MLRLSGTCYNTGLCVSCSAVSGLVLLTLSLTLLSLFLSVPVFVSQCLSVALCITVSLKLKSDMAGNGYNPLKLHCDPLRSQKPS